MWNKDVSLTSEQAHLSQAQGAKREGKENDTKELSKKEKGQVEVKNRKE